MFLFLFLKQTLWRKKWRKWLTILFLRLRNSSSHNTMLASFNVAWSPILKNSSSCRCVLVIGGKCDRISFWRIHGLQSYSFGDNGDSTTTTLMGFSEHMIPRSQHLIGYCLILMLQILSFFWVPKVLKGGEWLCWQKIVNLLEREIQNQ